MNCKIYTFAGAGFLAPEISHPAAQLRPHLKYLNGI